MTKHTFRHVAARLNNAGTLLHSIGRYQEATAIYKEAVPIMMSSLKDDYTITDQKRGKALRTRFQTGILMKKTETGVHGANYDGNIQTNIINDNIIIEQHGPTNFVQPIQIPYEMCQGGSIVSIALLYNMALIKYQIGEEKKALNLLHLALSMTSPASTDVGYIHAVGVAIRHNMGKIYYEQGDTEEAWKVLTDAFEFGKERLGNHILVTRTLKTIGDIMFSKGYISDAMMVFEEAAWIYNQIPLQDRTAFSMNMTCNIDDCGAAAA